MIGPVYRLLDGGHYVASPWVLGEAADGELLVPSVRERLRRGEPYWVALYNPRNPLHWPFALWTVLRRGVAFIE